MRVRMTVAYDGTEFRGFAAQAGVRTVAGVLAGALEQSLRHRVELTCAGRTDAGVHAWGQVVSFDAAAGDLEPELVMRSLNRRLMPEVAVRELAVVAEDFDARRSARSRRYRYRVLNRVAPDPFLARTSWHVPEPLDVRAMKAAGDPLLGEHDFASFCRANGSLVRRVTELDWYDDGDGRLRFEIEASSFCQQMVRSVVGTMVDMGRGRRRAGEMAAILRARDRGCAGKMAPPQGLTLWRVRYADD